MIRIGIVGCGRILAAHLRGYQILREAGYNNFRISALCARKLDDARSYAKRGEGPSQRKPVSNIAGDPLALGDIYVSDFQSEPVAVFDDFHDMIANGPIDAVNDYTSHELHHIIAKESFRAGHHLLSQKPLAVSLEAARQMCDQAAAANCVLGTFENWRYRPRNRQLKWLFESTTNAEIPEGPCGRLQFVLFGNMGNWWAPNQIVAETPWRHQKAFGGGISLDMGPHIFDMVRYIGGEVVEIEARTSILEPTRVTLDGAGDVTQSIECDADDTFSASFLTTARVTGNIFASWAGHGAGTVVGAGPVLYGARGRVSGDTVTLGSGEETTLGELYSANASAERKERDFPSGLTDEFALAQLDWLQAIEQNRQPEASGEEGFRDLACAHAILESSEIGRRVSLSAE